MKEILESLKRLWAMKALVIVLIFLGCESVEEKIRAQAWLIDREEPGVFRAISDEEEEFIPINEPILDRFACMHEDDVKRWVRYCRRRCRE